LGFWQGTAFALIVSFPSMSGLHAAGNNRLSLLCLCAPCFPVDPPFRLALLFELRSSVISSLQVSEHFIP
jgi:hypothetical protein